jgi:hypothetical protein
MRAAPPDLESMSAQEVLAHVVDEHHPRVHCTLPGGGREGRWAGTDKIECGLHLPSAT